MPPTLFVAAAVLLLCAAAHSYLGERYILIRLFRRDNIPHLLGSDWFTKSTLRWTWHITSLAWIGFAALLVGVGRNEAAGSLVLEVVAITFFVTALVAFAASRGKHLSWIPFLAVAVLTWLAR